MITEDYVSFEVATLLKEKGFREKCIATYNLVTKNFVIEEVYQDWTTRWGEAYVSAPTHQMAMRWLREVYGLFIRIIEDTTGNVFEWSVYQKNYGCKASTYVEDSYEQACETAIKYCLENLI